MSRKFGTINAIAAALPIDNIDTDKILPGRFLKTVTRAGLGQALFAGLRYAEDGSERPDFVLNRDPWRQAGILVGGANFGCGSSREHAPWALVDFGITCLIAPSFADIFYNNCFKNGILPIRLGHDLHAAVIHMASDPVTARFSIDLERQTVDPVAGERISFDLDAGHKRALIEGRDDIAMSFLHLDEIAEWENRQAHPPADARSVL